MGVASVLYSLTKLNEDRIRVFHAEKHWKHWTESVAFPTQLATRRSASPWTHSRWATACQRGLCAALDCIPAVKNLAVRHAHSDMKPFQQRAAATTRRLVPVRLTQQASPSETQPWPCGPSNSTLCGQTSSKHPRLVLPCGEHLAASFNLG